VSAEPEPEPELAPATPIVPADPITTAEQTAAALPVEHESAAPVPVASTGSLDTAPADTSAPDPMADRAPAADPPAEERAPAPARPTASAAPATRVDEAKAARQALADDLADVIHNVLSTTQFATKTMKPGRYSHAEMVLDAEATDLASELAREALPHPVAIRSRLGRMERMLALASVGMMIAGGYFAFSLWGDGRTGAAPSPVIAAPAPSPDARGERTHDLARDLGTAAVVIDMPGAAGATPQSGWKSGVSPPRPHTPRVAR